MYFFNKFRFLLIRLSLAVCVLTYAKGICAQTALDRTLSPSGEDSVSNVFRDMGVVQRKAMQKRHRFLLSNYGSLDFSDGPFSIYGFNVNIGFAISDFWEVYINTVPFFLSTPRSIVDKLKNIQGLYGSDGEARTIDIDTNAPKHQVGAELLWAPAYGKDSVGSRRVIRSDTFFKAGYSMIFYQEGQRGNKFHLGVGKTYFLTNWLGFRLVASGNYMQTIVSVDNAVAKPSYGFFAIVEAGFVFYL